MKKPRLLILCVIVLALAIAGGSWLLPKPANVEVAAYYAPSGTMITLFDSAIAIGASIVFFAALRNFKPELKPAYRFLAFATLGYGIFTLTYPYIEYFGLWGNILISITSYFAYLFGGPLMYLAARQFFKRVGLEGKVTSIPLVVVATIVLWGLLQLVPHAEGVWPSNWLYAVMQVIVIIPVVAYVVAAYMLWRVRQKTGLGYRRPFGWLMAGLVFQVLGAGSVKVLEVIGYENWYFTHRVIWAPIIIGDLCILLAGYYFNTVGTANQGRGWLRRLFGSAQEGPATSFDIITYVASMAADPKAIDPFLDDMRVITSSLTPGDQTISGEAQRKLCGVYISIENYLIKSDQLRNYDQGQLRNDVVDRFQLNPADKSTFWPLLQH